MTCFYVVIELKRFFQNFFSESKINDDHAIFAAPYIYINKKVNRDNQIILWHLSGSDIEKEDLPKYISQINYHYGNKIIAKIGKSESDNWIKMAESLEWFNYVNKGRNIEKFFEIECNWDTEQIINKSQKIHTQISEQQIGTKILHLFLPLDIDMQALEIIKKDDKKVEAYLWGDKDKVIEGMFESREGDEHYRQKLYDFWYLLGKKDYLEEIGKRASSKIENLTPIDNPNKNILTLAGLNNGEPQKTPIYKFLNSLDAGKKDKEVKVEYLCKPFNLEVEVKDKRETIKTFPDWYRALARCLRNEE